MRPLEDPQTKRLIAMGPEVSLTRGVHPVFDGPAQRNTTVCNMSAIGFSGYL